MNNTSAIVIRALALNFPYWARYAGLLQASDFDLPLHQHVFTALDRLIKAGRASDRVAVCRYVEQAFGWQDVASLEELYAHPDKLPDEDTVFNCINSLRDASWLNRLAGAGQSIISLAKHAQDKSLTVVLDEAEYAIWQVAQTLPTGWKSPEPPSLANMLGQFREKLVSSAVHTEDDIEEHFSGKNDMDRLAQGLLGGELVIMRSSPETDVFADCLKSATRLILDQVHVVIFSSHVGATSIMHKLISIASDVDEERVRHRVVTQEEQERVKDTCHRLAHSGSMFTEDLNGLSIFELRNRARILNRRTGQLGLVVVDSLDTLQEFHSESGKPAMSISEICTSLNDLARELGCQMILVSRSELPDALNLRSFR